MCEKAHGVGYEMFSVSAAMTWETFSPSPRLHAGQLIDSGYSHARGNHQLQSVICEARVSVARSEGKQEDAGQVSPYVVLTAGG